MVWKVFLSLNTEYDSLEGDSIGFWVLENTLLIERSREEKKLSPVFWLMF